MTSDDSHGERRGIDDDRGGPSDGASGRDDDRLPPRWDAFEDDPPPDRGGRRRLLYAAAAIPWLVVGAVLLRPPDPAAGPQDHAGASHAEEAVADPGAEAWVGGPFDDAPTWLDDLADAYGDDPFPGPDALVFGGRSTPTAGDAAAVAVLVARDWLGGLGPSLGFERAGRPTYVEHVVVEAIDFPAPGAAVVAVLAVVLDADGGEYAAARAVRAAVPVRLDRSGARPAGTPWMLPGPDLAIDEPEWGERITDPHALVEAGEALVAAGYRDVEVEAVDLGPGWPIRVVFRAVAPGADSPADHEIWLRDHLGVLVVAGWLPQTPPAPTTEGGR